MKKGGEQLKEPNQERWLITYADLMNNLLILFIMLYSLSATDVLKFKSFMSSFNLAYTGGEAGTTTSVNSEIEQIINNPGEWSEWYVTSGTTSGTGSYSGDHSGNYSSVPRVLWRNNRRRITVSARRLLA
jgi:flagellar motor protein MotB